MNYASLISALMAVETGGHRTADLVIGDGGRAIGALQIHRSVVEDVNRFAGTHYSWKGMTNRADARRVCDLYLQRYAKGRSMEDAARIWNGGPSGHLKPSTEAYWAKVQRNMNHNIAKN